MGVVVLSVGGGGEPMVLRSVLLGRVWQTGGLFFHFVWVALL